MAGEGIAMQYKRVILEHGRFTRFRPSTARCRMCPDPTAAAVLPPPRGIGKRPVRRRWPWNGVAHTPKSKILVTSHRKPGQPTG
ncbi:hypothetical protein DAI22_03g024400 [Oryza sativa Japonica Group]|nr:hypothetical protein DAI22_03g024400 [Oryza sativa Japonica Group]